MAGEIGHWCGIGLIGGGLGTVDKIDGAALQDKEGFLVITPTVFAPFSLDVNSGAGENSPQIIAPNTNPGAKRWILAKGVFAGLTLYGDIAVDGSALTITGSGTSYNALVVGTPDTVRALIIAAGHATGEAQGGLLRAETSADYDGTITHYDISAYEDDLFIGPNTDPDSLKYNGGTGNWTFTGTGKVGIGIANPWAKVHINRPTAGVAALNKDDVSDLAIFVNAVTTPGNYQPLIGVGESASIFTAAICSFDDGGSAAQGLTFHTGTVAAITERMRITSAGKVGINDNSPGEILDVGGNINTTGVYKVDDLKIIGPRQIDARIDDAINCGDATTDGVIDAMRDAMISHGLIATP